VHRGEVAVALFVPEDDDVAAMQSARGVGRLLQDRRTGAVYSRCAEESRGKLLDELAAALDGGGHLARGNTQARVDTCGPVPEGPALSADQHVEYVPASAAEAVGGVDEVDVGRLLE
jgi:hypothetical protein